MNGARVGLSSCFLAALTALGCTRPVVPEHVRGRVAYGEVNPAGTWVQVAEDGSTSTIELTVPEGRHQLFGVRWSGQGGRLDGEAFVDGDTVYATRHSGSAANDLCLYLYERRGGVVEAIWGSARGAAPVAYEQAHLAASREGDWNGVYAEWGNNMGGVYQDRLIIGRALQGDPRIHRLHWTQSNNGWYRGRRSSSASGSSACDCPACSSTSPRRSSATTSSRSEAPRSAAACTGCSARIGSRATRSSASRRPPAIRR